MGAPERDVKGSSGGNLTKEKKPKLFPRRTSRDPSTGYNWILKNMACDVRTKGFMVYRVSV